jgi:hypothetical protein
VVRPIGAILVLATLVPAMALTATAAQAQIYDPRYPVCMHSYGVQTGDRIDCIFTSLFQCKASASGLPAMCEINPYFAQASGHPPRH